MGTSTAWTCRLPAQLAPAAPADCYGTRMGDPSEPAVTAVGATVLGTGGARIGRVDAVFVDYLLVRTAGLLPMDLYLPASEATIEAPDRVRVELGPREAYRRWHRPLKSVTHD